MLVPKLAINEGKITIMGLFSRNIPLEGPLELSPWRSIALLAWDSISDASVHAVIEVEAGPMLQFIERRSKSSGRHISTIHFVGKTLAEVLREFPDVNCILRRRRLYRRRDVDIMFPVALDRAGYDLSAAVIRNADAKPLEDIANELSKIASDLRSQGGSSFKAGTHILQRPLLRFAQFILYTLNIWTPLLGLPRNAFGSAAVSDVSSFGADFAFPPLLPIARLPIVVGVGPIFEKYGPDGKTTKWLRLFLVFDHRVIDGVYAGRICHFIRGVFAKPEDHCGNGARADAPESTA